MLELVATVDLSSSRLVGPGGSTMAEIAPDGRVLGPLSQQLGSVRPFSYSRQDLAALYLLFLDPELISG